MAGSANTGGKVHAGEADTAPPFKITTALDTLMITTGAVSPIPYTIIGVSSRDTHIATTLPEPCVLTAPVERRTVDSTVIERGTVMGDQLRSVTPPIEPGISAQYLSAVDVAAGDTIHPGELLLAVSGRPLFALAGVVPAYRDLALGSKGPDVAQLQTALQFLGGAGKDPSGTFGNGTAASLSRLYVGSGYTPVVVAGKPSLPLAEVAYIPSFPATVTNVGGTIGDAVKAPLLTLQTGFLHVSVSLQPDEAQLIRKGTTASLVAEALDEQANGTVSKVDPVTTTASQDPNSQGDGADAASANRIVPVTIEPASPLPASWLGQDVRVTFVSARSPAASSTTARAAKLRTREGGGRRRRLRTSDRVEGSTRERRPRAHRPMSKPLVEMDSLGLLYPGPPAFLALHDLNLCVPVGEYLSITGASGSGKSSLLNIVGLLDRPTSGTYRLDGVDVSTLTERDRTALRARRIGFVFQSFHLLPARTAVANVMLAMTYVGLPVQERRRRSVAVLQRFGLGHPRACNSAPG